MLCAGAWLALWMQQGVVDNHTSAREDLAPFAVWCVEQRWFVWLAALLQCVVGTVLIITKRGRIRMLLVCTLPSVAAAAAAMISFVLLLRPLYGLE